MVACMCISLFLVASAIQDKSCSVGLKFTLPETRMDFMVGLKVEVVNVFITSSSYCTLVFMHVHGICVCVALLRANFKINIDTVGVQHSFSSEQPTHLPLFFKFFKFRLLYDSFAVALCALAAVQLRLPS